MNLDEIADLGKTFFDAVHATIDALPDDHRKAVLARLAKRSHEAADMMRALAVGDGMIQPMSGGGPK